MLISTLWQIGVPRVAIALGDAPILIVDAEFRALVAAHLATLLDRLALGVIVP